MVFLAVTAIAGCDGSNNNESDASHFTGNAVQQNTDPVTESDAADGITAGAVSTPLNKGRWDPAPRKQRPLKGIARQRQQKYTAMINQEAHRAGIDPAFIHAIISQESKYNTNAVSTICRKTGGRKICKKDHTTAHGLMQIMPATAKQLGLSPSMRRSHPRKNVRAGIKYFTWMKWAKGNMQAMAAGYNSGPARAKALFTGNRNSRYWRGAQTSTSNGVPGKAFWGGETYHYAQNVAGYYELYKANPNLIGLGSKPLNRSSMCRERNLC